ncbi:MAG: hypothetical protein ACOYBT_09770 [Polynucleobacter sp.]
MTSPTTADSIRRLIAAMPVTDQIALVQDITNTAQFADFDIRDTEALETALANMARSAMQDEFEADQRDDAGSFLFLRQPYGMTPAARGSAL